LPVAVSEAEFLQVIEHTLKKHHKVAFLLGFGSGMRVSEIIHLEKRDVDAANKRITVRQGKGGKDRVVPLPKGWKGWMLDYLPIKCGVRSLERAFLSACKKADLLKNKPSLHFHSLRHGFASELVTKGMPIHQVSVLMGHALVSTTAIYLQANPNEALEKYNEVF